MHRFLQRLFFALIVRPLVLVVIGLNVRHRQRLPDAGPVILVANHNSHLDTLVLMTLMPARLLRRLRPVAASDYFMTRRWLAWFALHIMHIVPIRRGGHGTGDPLAPVAEALRQGDIVILFPEGSRGEPERLQSLRKGIAHLAARFPEVPVVPIFLHGLGKSLPKGEALLVPFFCDVFVGRPLHWQGDRDRFMDELSTTLHTLSAGERFPAWD